MDRMALPWTDTDKEKIKRKQDKPSKFWHLRLYRRISQQYVRHEDQPIRNRLDGCHVHRHEQRHGYDCWSHKRTRILYRGHQHDRLLIQHGHRHCSNDGRHSDARLHDHDGRQLPQRLPKRKLFSFGRSDCENLVDGEQVHSDVQAHGVVDDDELVRDVLRGDVHDVQVLVATLLACVVAAPVDDDVHAEVKELKSDVRADGFDFTLDTSNNIHEQASGDAHGNIHGDFEWVSPEGVHVKVSYVADEQGYHPSSDLLPTPPPVPAAILKALEFINAHPQKEEAKH
uniref:Larval cuticle protein 2 n=1 Tax=Glossina austeni TaxID=7395 RepID=A0A1A9VV32_GLOAU